MSKKLELTFLTSTGKNATIRISDPKDNVTKAEAFAVMDQIIDKNIFVYNSADLVQKVRARINSVTELE